MSQIVLQRSRWPVSTATVLAGLLLASPAIADETVTGIGTVLCQDGSDSSTRPLEGVRVELMDSDCDGSEICDDVMGIGYSDANGSFSVTGSGGDPFGGKPDVYVRFAYNDDHGVRLTNEIDSTRSVSTQQHDHNNVGGGTINFGQLTIGGDLSAGEGSQCAVWSKSRNAFRKFVLETSQEPPAGHLDVLYWSAVWSGTPWTNTDTIHWPVHYISYAVNHEFGHSIRHSADGNGSHFALDVAKYRYARNHHRCAMDANAQPGEALASVAGFGFNEGWAEYWANDVSGCPGALDSAIEGEIAEALYWLQVGNGMTRSDMVGVLKDNPGGIHSFDEFAVAASRRLGKSKSALLSAATPKSFLLIDRTVQLGAPLSEVQRLATIRAQLVWLRSRIARLRQVVPVRQQLHVDLTSQCQLDACEAIFNRIIGPVLREGEASALDAYARSLNDAMQPKWPARMQQLRSSGEFDVWIRAYRANLAENMRQPMEQALSQAVVVLGQNRAALGTSLPAFRAELASARARVQSGASGGKYRFAPAQMNSDERLR